MKVRLKNNQAEVEKHDETYIVDFKGFRFGFTEKEFIALFEEVPESEEQPKPDASDDGYLKQLKSLRAEILKGAEKETIRENLSYVRDVVFDALEKIDALIMAQERFENEMQPKIKVASYPEAG